ncbi:unnamed protein product, partial [Didymodactylos carnosus]
HPFDVAFLFPCEIRAQVEQICDVLRAKIDVLYDHYYRAELSRPNLDLYLQSNDHHETKLTVIFLSKEHDCKEQCGLEFHAIENLIKTKQDDQIMLLKDHSHRMSTRCRDNTPAEYQPLFENSG